MDTLIRNATIVDGTGAPAFRGDLALREGVITLTGSIGETRAERVIDADSLVAAPGFIDMHSHADFSLPVIPTADSLLHQGITTVVTGQCGFSPAPLFKESRDQVIPSLGLIMEDLAALIPWDEWSSFHDFLAFFERKGISVNVVPLVGQGTVRSGVVGFQQEAPDRAGMERMQAEVRKAMEQGAIGLSTGLIYPPGSYASTGELVELTRVVGALHGFYFSHIRGEGETLVEAVEEAIHIGEASGAAVQVSHFKAAGRANWPLSARALESIDRARTRGLDVYTDMYPYTAGSTGLVAFLPEWAQEGGKEKILRRLASAAERDRIKQDMASGGFAKGVDWGGVLISECAGSPLWEGRYVAALAEEAGKAPVDWVMDALQETRLAVNMITFAMSEENRRREMRHPAMTFCTDGLGLTDHGSLAKGRPHPRSFGSFPRILGRYVRDEGVLSLEDAVHKMTGLAARRLRLKDRGTLRPGQAADIVLFDLEKVRETATYEEPRRFAEGLQYVLVNGRPVIEDGVHTRLRPGRVLRRS